ncbi:transposase [Planctomycetota bacterium]
MKNMGYRRARYRGLRRNGMNFMLHAIAYNFKRSFGLQATGA